MAVKQTYTATATWTPADLANIFRSAFIDGGLMTDWFDSFSSGGVENRVLEVVYNGAKTYGKTYYWFKFTTTGFWTAYTTGWNTTADVPTGSQYLDWVSNSVGDTTGHDQRLAMSSTVTTTLTRYTSTGSGAMTWFLVRNGSGSHVFMIDKAGITVNPVIDLDRMIHCGYRSLNITGAGSAWKRMTFYSIAGLRRSYVGSNTLAGTSVFPNNYIIGGMCYGVTSRATSNVASQISQIGLTDGGCFALPMAVSTVNPGFATNKTPIVTGLPLDLLISSVLPADIGIITHYAHNTLALQDRFIVTAGAEEWEIINVQNGDAVNTGVTMAFAARIV